MKKAVRVVYAAFVDMVCDVLLATYRGCLVGIVLGVAVGVGIPVWNAVTRILY